jgi:hypothetical protein
LAALFTINSQNTEELKMRKLMLSISLVALLIVLGVVFLREQPDFTILLPTVVPNSPSGMVVGVPAGTQFDASAKVNEHGYATYGYDISATFISTNVAPGKSPVGAPHSAINVLGSGNPTLTTTIVNPYWQHQVFSAYDTVKLTWSGKFRILRTIEKTFSKTITVTLPSASIRVVGINQEISSQKTSSIGVSLAPPLDVPVTAKLTANSGMTLSPNEVQIALGQREGIVNATAPVRHCSDEPSAVGPDACLGSIVTASLFVDGVGIASTRMCVRVTCE